MKGWLWLLFLWMISTNVNAQDGIGVGDTLYRWNSGALFIRVLFEETRIIACHPTDKSLTLSRETHVSGGGVMQSSVRVSVGDTFLL
jgi:hypothetical protein